MKTLTLEQLITQVRAVAQYAECIANSTTSTRTQLAFYDIDAQPEDIAKALREALPDWHGARYDGGSKGAWAEILRSQAEIVAYVTPAQARAHAARKKAA